MEHSIFFDGNSKKIGWIIKNEDSEIFQEREHAEMYLNKITNLQSKYIALHVGLFWGIGRYIIHDGDKINVKMDNRIMFDHLSNNKTSSDEFINTRTDFILQFIKQRKLNENYQLIKTEENLAEKLI